MKGLWRDPRLYLSDVERSVISAIANGEVTFADLVRCLPGVYPSVVADTVRSLDRRGKVPLRTLKSLSRATASKPLAGYRARIDLTRFPVSHPHEYVWLFTETTAQDLLLRASNHCPPGGLVTLIGVPTLLRHVGANLRPQRVISIDTHHGLALRVGRGGFRCRSIVVDVVSHTPKAPKADVLVLDPPWYLDYSKAFLWSARRLGRTKAVIMTCLPALGTRPGVLRERIHLVKWAQNAGLELRALEENVLSYVTPFFESNALESEGLANVPVDWRRGDLATFVATGPALAPKPVVRDPTRSWLSRRVGMTEFRVRPQSSTRFGDPTLRSVIPGDVLPSVSRRDVRRDIVDVWTSGNRVYGCEGRDTLLAIMRARGDSLDSRAAVRAQLKRGLHHDEEMLVDSATRQVVRIANLEKREFRAYLRRLRRGIS